jgi:hypothetical protein
MKKWMKGFMRKSKQSVVTLPNGWKTWCKQVGLRAQGRWNKNSRRTSDYFYLKGKGHCWRVNYHGEFEIGDSYEEFARWALCDTHSVLLPKTKQEFISAVEFLLNEKLSQRVE